MDNILLDSSIWIALFDTNDSQYAKATELFHVLLKEECNLIINNYIDLECISILNQKAGREKAINWISFHRKSPYTVFQNIDNQAHQEITELFLTTQSQKLSFVDISLLYFQKNGYMVYTFDKKLQKALIS